MLGRAAIDVLQRAQKSEIYIVRPDKYSSLAHTWHIIPVRVYYTACEAEIEPTTILIFTTLY